MSVKLCLVTLDNEVIESPNIRNFGDGAKNEKLCHQIGRSMVKRLPNIKNYEIAISSAGYPIQLKTSIERA